MAGVYEGLTVDEETIGVGVFISNRRFVGDHVKHCESRPYDSSDSSELPDVFKLMGIDMKNHMNESTANFDRLVTDTSNCCENTKSKILVVVISSHGKETCTPSPGGAADKSYVHETAFTDDWMETRCIVEEFSKCIDAELPKVFIIQACSSRDGSVDAAKYKTDHAEDKGITIQLTDKEPEQDLSGYKTETNMDASSEEHGAVIPACVRNSVVVFTSAPGKYSYADQEYGGWYLDNLRTFLKDDKYLKVGVEFSLLDLFTKVNKEMSSYEAQESAHYRCKAVASVNHKLTKDIMLKKRKSLE